MSSLQEEFNAIVHAGDQKAKVVLSLLPKTTGIFGVPEYVDAKVDCNKCSMDLNLSPDGITMVNITAFTGLEGSARVLDCDMDPSGMIKGDLDLQMLHRGVIGDRIPWDFQIRNTHMVWHVASDLEATVGGAFGFAEEGVQAAVVVSRRELGFHKVGS
ncbi:hypothetical protein NE237_004079 [Protea cynaroides]|uniref:Uncharacterized protein n=1 Tax=Protea cynaroides TaxID=273540 RepID=A0A9Q0QT75_9MAGN|nr:hypothetical protein NE237_004079 [Protea cynaroides]